MLPLKTECTVTRALASVERNWV